MTKNFYYSVLVEDFSLNNRLLDNMSSAKSLCFYLSLISVAVPHVFSSGVNKTTADGKVFITGDHNKVVVSTAQETKIALTELTKKLQALEKRILSQDEIRGKLDAINETVKSYSNTVESLDQKLEMKLDVVNKSNVALSLQVQAMSLKLQKTLERQGMHIQSDYPHLLSRQICACTQVISDLLLAYFIINRKTESYERDHSNFIQTS